MRPVRDADALAGFLERHRRLFVLTGAGCSTPSGIPDYRDESGAWKQHRPMSFAEFTSSPAARRRYCASVLAHAVAAGVVSGEA